MDDETFAARLLLLLSPHLSPRKARGVTLAALFPGRFVPAWAADAAHALVLRGVLARDRSPSGRGLFRWADPGNLADPGGWGVAIFNGRTPNSAAWRGRRVFRKPPGGE